MSPTVEKFTEKEFSGNINFFTIDLTTTEPMDMDYFDRLFNKAFPAHLHGGEAKYIVYSDVMYIFNARLTHDDFFIAKEEGLQSAGRVRMPVLDESARRLIYDYSTNLQEAPHNLSRAASDLYKKTILKEKLGQYFDIQ